jgi:NADPH2:quinone reductase
MRAVLCRTFGPPETLVLENVPDPTPGPGEALVDIAYVGLNFFDTLIIENKYQTKPPLPFSPGGEFSGTISALGLAVTDFKVGDKVAGSSGFGAAREKIAIPIEQLVKVPDGLALEKAAGLLITYGTSLHALKQRARLQRGETLAVLGASGGVGIAAVEIGHLMGARVIACASSPDKIAFAREHGADEGIDYSAEDLRAAFKRVSGGKGIDVIYDPVGGDYSEIGVRSMAWKGRFLVVGFAAGTIPKIPLNLALLKGCDIVGVFWGAFTKAEPQASRENNAEILAWARDGKLDAHIHAILPLEKAAEALGLLTRREAKGKVLLKP